MKLFKMKLIAATVTLACNLPVHATLERVGPASSAPSVGGFPAWYQDHTGLTMEFCAPLNPAEVAGGWCLLLPGDVNTTPEVFPTSFFDEHFYWAASASAPAQPGIRAMLVLAEEAAFSAGAARPGDQVTFSRIRMVLNPVPATGTYRFIHPFGEDVIDAVAGSKIFVTDDVGIGSPGDFTGALGSRLGPFLLPSATPGGPEMPPLTAANPTPDTDPAHFGGAFAATPYPGTGKAYIADPARIGPVTGSSLPNFIDSTGASRNHNIFRIEGPDGAVLGVDPISGATVNWVETTDFSLMGRVFNGTIPGRINVDRASYSRSATGGQKVDVFATASETTQARLPAQPRPGAIAPQLTFFDAPCGGTVDPVTLEVLPPFSAPAGATETQMFAIEPGIHFGQIAPAAVPTSVCIRDSAARDAAGNIVPVFVTRSVTDEVGITQAYFDRSAGTLTVAATSSDQLAPPTLSLSFGKFQGNLASGQIVVPGLIAAPAKVLVSSSKLGTSQAQVSTSPPGAGPAGIPVANNDSFTFVEDSPAQSLILTANDGDVGGGTINLTSLPRLGTALVNATNTGVFYTPNPNANGTDLFTYTVTLGTQVSNTGTVTLNITPVNDPPTAVNDSTNAIVNVTQSINVLANDLDPDGLGDLVAVANLTQPAVGASVAPGTGGIVNFTASAGGTYTFTYQAQDTAGAVSATAATVTVQVAAAETVTIAKNEYVRSKSMLKAQGSVSPASGQTVRLEFTNAGGSVLGLVGTFATDAAGAWQAQTVVPLPTGATTLKATSSNNTVRTQALTLR